MTIEREEILREMMERVREEKTPEPDAEHFEKECRSQNDEEFKTTYSIFWNSRV